MSFIRFNDFNFLKIEISNMLNFLLTFMIKSIKLATVKEKLKIIMKKFTLPPLLGLLSVVLLLFACKEEVLVQQEPQSALEEIISENSDGQIVLGKKLENPYSVENMKKAYTSLMEKKKNSKKQYLGKVLTDETQIEVTDYYVKFLVENDVQKSLLVADSLNLSVIPLDVEVEEEGDYYVDESTPVEEAEWLYTSVPKDYNFHPEITYKIIEELFLFEEPETDEETEGITISGKGNIATNFLLDLEDEALQLTNNWEAPEKGTGLLARSRATPKGWIRVINTETGEAEGVEGVKVVTRRWFKWGRAYTTSNGYYRINKSYRRDVNYKIHFENKSGFKIWQSIVNIHHATYRMGKHSKRGRDITFNTNSVGWSWSTVNNATLQYFRYCDQFGIGRPHNNLRIVASRGEGSSSAPMLRRTLGHIKVAQALTFLTTVATKGSAAYFWIAVRFVLPDIIIRANSGNGTQGVYSTTFHELAHASHYKKVGNAYWGRYIDKIIANWFEDKNRPYGNGTGKDHELIALGEAWGFHMGYFLTIQRFGATNEVLNLNAFDNFDPLDRPEVRASGRYGNTNNIGWRGWMPGGIIHDLIDEPRDIVRAGFVDNVNGYTLKNIYDALDADVATPQQFRDRLLRENGNRDEADVRELFEAYFWD